jgi:hypothetical protein
VLLGVGPSQSIEYVFGDEGPKRCWHTQDEVGQAQGTWEKQVQKVVTKGNKALSFIRRNAGSCPEEVKKQAYLALVRPHLEYASSAWDPHLQKHIQ